MASSGPVVRTLAGFAALVLLTAACGGGGKKTATKSSSTTGVENTTTSVADTSTTAAAGATATTKPGASTATTKAGAKVNGQAAGSYTPPAGSTAAAPAKPGTYKYDTSGTTSFGAQSSSPPPVTPLVVDPPAGTRQHSTHDSRKPDGSGSVGETTLDYQPQGVFLVELKITTKAAGITDVQDFVANPPVNVAPTGVKPGQSVEFDISGSGTNVHVKIDFVRTERLAIGGQAVDTMVIHQT
ncbi:MAG: hypothetical protein JWP02_3020 [Acidimicrobiales bacterium]|nr:hypothetical protein [Acidimicrobiales bacterium]